MTTTPVRSSFRLPGRAPALPAPAERERLRAAWGLSRAQVADAFEVHASTVRSWETGRSAPRGARREAYARFLAGLAQGAPAPAGDSPGEGGPDAGSGPLVPHPAGPGGTALPARAELPAARRGGPAVPGATPAPPAPAPSARPVTEVPALLLTRPDPVAEVRRRRLRRMAAAVSVWMLFLYLWQALPLG
ncbi:helix-turn-helix domain-containing protein [Streptomyces sp. BI20]|uniref:helix-turn-helix domain-containing protein n=1 Tax=Streptomyces sp. BI20 TaxID=3403460 RepID=UPI003C77BF0A